MTKGQKRQQLDTASVATQDQGEILPTETLIAAVTATQSSKAERFIRQLLNKTNTPGSDQLHIVPLSLD